MSEKFSNKNLNDHEIIELYYKLIGIPTITSKKKGKIEGNRSNIVILDEVNDINEEKLTGMKMDNLTGLSFLIDNPTPPWTMPPKLRRDFKITNDMIRFVYLFGTDGANVWQISPPVAK